MKVYANERAKYLGWPTPLTKCCAASNSRLRMQLAALDTAQTIDDMNIPGFRLHPLKGEMRGRWSIMVSGHWRVTFEFPEGNAYVLDYEDYH